MSGWLHVEQLNKETSKQGPHFFFWRKRCSSTTNHRANMTNNLTKTSVLNNLVVETETP